ncbi:MAG: EF-P lysine aminoacylase EpmA [Deltaproteobacteria bacterium]|jgi:lysyl-tRNA synthetase class 2|nr:EF-P lysine aminoacylase EpmA [Deltaproteobacteria bacterium]
MKPVLARIISAAPPQAQNHIQTYQLQTIPSSKYKTGDWVYLDQIPGSNNYRINGMAQPTQSQFPSFEWKRLHQQLDNGLNRIEILKLRSRILHQIREFFRTKGHLEVETPLLVPSPGVETHLKAIKTDHYFLSPSPEFQMKRLLAGGIGSIYQIAHSFRAGETGNRHNPEFTMLEWYSTGINGEELRRETEELISFLQSNLELPCPLPEPPYRRITMAQAFAEHAGVTDLRASPRQMYKQAGILEKYQQKITWEEGFFEIFIEKVEPVLTKEGPVFLTQWPIEFASLSKPLDSNPKVADRFEFFAENLEIANGFAELIEPDIQRQRCLEDLEYRRKHKLELYPLDEKFLNSLKEAMPPTSGIALGLDRLIMLFAGTSKIENALTFSHFEL